MPAKLIPPIGLPSASNNSDYEAWLLLIATQLSEVRKTAENWRNGLVAIVGLITAFSIIKGPDNISSLTNWAGITVGMLLLIALFCAIFGIWSSLIAAYGEPTVITRQEFQELGGSNGFRLKLAREAISKLRYAQIATISTLILLTGAIGITWYGPRTETIILAIEWKSQPNVCGKILSSGNGYLNIRTSTSDLVRVPMKNIIKLSVVENCL
jgi:hypothetical protein